MSIKRECEGIICAASVYRRIPPPPGFISRPETSKQGELIRRAPCLSGERGVRSLKGLVRAPRLPCRHTFVAQMWFATVADGVSDGASGSGASPKPELASPSPSGGEEAKELLLRLFGGWHAPIPSLLRATEGAGIAREEARAMSRRGLRAAVAAGAAAQQAGWELALVGDAAHTVRETASHPGLKHLCKSGKCAAGIQPNTIMVSYIHTLYDVIFFRQLVGPTPARFR